MCPIRGNSAWLKHCGGMRSADQGVEPVAVRSPPHTAQIVVGASLAVIAVVITASVRGGFAHLSASFDAGVDPLPHARIAVLVLVVVLTGLHYVAAAVAARAATPCPTALPEMVLVQLASATANRITPAGLGGWAVLSRYLNRRWSTPLSGALGVVTALTVLGGVADLALVALVVVAGSLVGLRGGAAELTSLAQLAAGLQRHWLVVAAAAVAVAVPTLVLIRRRLRSRGSSASVRSGTRLAGYRRPLAELARRPSAIIVLLAASAATTLVLAIAFAECTRALPGVQPHASFGALVIGYMIAAGVAGALPVPAGFGTADAAFVAILLNAQIAAPAAVADVLLFRVLTYWLPAVVGLAAVGRLRRVRAL